MKQHAETEKSWFCRCELMWTYFKFMHLMNECLWNRRYPKFIIAVFSFLYEMLNIKSRYISSTMVPPWIALLSADNNSLLLHLPGMIQSDAADSSASPPSSSFSSSSPFLFDFCIFSLLMLASWSSRLLALLLCRPELWGKIGFHYLFMSWDAPFRPSRTRAIMTNGSV